MMTLKLDGRNIEVLDAYMVNDDEGGLVLGFVANINDLLPKDLIKDLLAKIHCFDAFPKLLKLSFKFCFNFHI